MFEKSGGKKYNKIAPSSFPYLDISFFLIQAILTHHLRKEHDVLILYPAPNTLTVIPLFDVFL